jgi:hypothetical protein
MDNVQKLNNYNNEAWLFTLLWQSFANSRFMQGLVYPPFETKCHQSKEHKVLQVVEP